MNIIGNIRQGYIKNIAYELLDKYPKEFKPGNFEHNKLKVVELTDVKSKLVRNRIAGYVTRILAPHIKSEAEVKYD